eukprot:497353_1
MTVNISRLLIVLSAAWCSCYGYKKCSFAKPSEMCVTECSTSKCKRMTGACKLAICPADRRRLRMEACRKGGKKGQRSICRTTDIRYDIDVVAHERFCEWKPGDYSRSCVAEKGADCKTFGRKSTGREIEGFPICKEKNGCGKKKNSDCLVVDCITDQMIYPETSPVSCCSIRLNEAGESIAKCEDYKGGSMGKIYKLKSRGLVCHQQAEENGEDYGGLLCEVDSENPVTSARIEIGLEMDELEMDEDKTSRDIKRLKRKITKGKKRLNHIRKNQQKL